MFLRRSVYFAKLDTKNDFWCSLKKFKNKHDLLTERDTELANIHSFKHYFRSRSIASRCSQRRSVCIASLWTKLASLIFRHLRARKTLLGKAFFGSRRPFWGGRKSHFFWTGDIWTAHFWAGGFVNSMGVRPNTCTAMEHGWTRCMFLCIVHQYTPTYRAHSCVCWVGDFDRCVAFYA